MSEKPGLLDRLLRGRDGPVIRAPEPKYNPRFDVYGVHAEATQDIRDVLGHEHFEMPVTPEYVRNTRLYSIGELGAMLERTTYTMHQWITHGLMPEADHWTAGTRETVELGHLQRGPSSRGGMKRRYTHAQVWGLRTIALEEGLLNNRRLPVKQTNFTQRAYDLWDDCAAEERSLPR